MPTDVDEIVVVDGHSEDRTVEVARLLWLTAIIVQQTRCRKGNAPACGFAAASGDIIVTLDADGSNDPGEIPDFVAALVAGADFVKGSRFMAGGGSSDIAWCRRAGNWGLGAVYNVLFGTRYTDLCYGYNAFWRHSLAAMALPDTGAGAPQWGDGFEVEALINARGCRGRADGLAEVCSFERDRLHGANNLHAVRGRDRVLTTIYQEYARPPPSRGACGFPLRWRSWPAVLGLRSRRRPLMQQGATGSLEEEALRDFYFKRGQRPVDTPIWPCNSFHTGNFRAGQNLGLIT